MNKILESRPSFPARKIPSAFACESCGSPTVSVTDSRPSAFRDVPAIRRRRKCATCGHAWTTFEIAEIDLEVAARPRPAAIKRAIIELVEKHL